ncbi:MAG: hypothetical protein A2016_05950 [Elusimicrobia bacterium GWF2_62_30]|nr:MAG: hypothetical protein A2016_05950 [Elusimicrobia bacterium GWF2_62_30]
MKTDTERQRLSAISAAYLAALLLFAAPARAAFDDLGAGARAPGMGNAFTAVADDVYAIYYNPAGLALLQRPEFAAAHTQHLTGLSDGSGLSTSFLGYAQPLAKNNGTLGAAIQNFSIDGGFYNERAICLSYGRAAPAVLGLEDLYWGVNVKNLRRSFGSLPEASNAYNGLTATGVSDPVLSGRSSVSAFDADLGLLYRLTENYTAGLELAHLPRPNVAFAAGQTDRLPLQTKLGFGYRNLLSNITAQYETLRSPAGTQDHLLTLALERWLPWLLVGNVGARAALSVGSREFRMATAGFSYRSGHVSVDYGFSMPINTIAETGGSHRLSFSLLFGAAKEEEPVKQALEAMRRIKTGKEPEQKAAAEIAPAAVGGQPAPGTGVRVESLLAMAAEAIEASRYKEAAFLSEAALKYQPENVAALENLGISYFALANYQKSLEAWRKAGRHETEKTRLTMINLQIGSVRNIIKQQKRPPAAEPAAAPAAEPAVVPAAVSAASPEAEPAAGPEEGKPDTDPVQKLYREGLELYIAGDLEQAGAVFRKVLEAEPGNKPASNAINRIQRELKEKGL